MFDIGISSIDMYSFFLNSQKRGTISDYYLLVIFERIRADDEGVMAQGLAVPGFIFSFLTYLSAVECIRA